MESSNVQALTDKPVLNWYVPSAQCVENAKTLGKAVLIGSALIAASSLAFTAPTLYTLGTIAFCVLDAHLINKILLAKNENANRQATNLAVAFVISGIVIGGATLGFTPLLLNEAYASLFGKALAVTATKVCYYSFLTTALWGFAGALSKNILTDIPQYKEKLDNYFKAINEGKLPAPRSIFDIWQVFLVLALNKETSMLTRYLSSPAFQLKVFLADDQERKALFDEATNRIRVCIYQMQFAPDTIEKMKTDIVSTVNSLKLILSYPSSTSQKEMFFKLVDLVEISSPKLLPPDSEPESKDMQTLYSEMKEIVPEYMKYLRQLFENSQKKEQKEMLLKILAVRPTIKADFSEILDSVAWNESNWLTPKSETILADIVYEYCKGLEKFKNYELEKENMAEFFATANRETRENLLKKENQIEKKNEQFSDNLKKLQDLSLCEDLLCKNDVVFEGTFEDKDIQHIFSSFNDAIKENDEHIAERTLPIKKLFNQYCVLKETIQSVNSKLKTSHVDDIDLDESVLDKFMFANPPKNLNDKTWEKLQSALCALLKVPQGNPSMLYDEMDKAGIGTVGDLINKGITNQEELKTREDHQWLELKVIDYLKNQQPDYKTRLYQLLSVSSNSMHSNLNAVQTALLRTAYRAVIIFSIAVPLMISPYITGIGFASALIGFGSYSIRHREIVDQTHAIRFAKWLPAIVRGFVISAMILARRPLLSLTDRDRETMNRFVNADFFGKMRILAFELGVTSFTGWTITINPNIDSDSVAAFFCGMTIGGLLGLETVQTVGLLGQSALRQVSRLWQRQPAVVV